MTSTTQTPGIRDVVFNHNLIDPDAFQIVRILQNRGFTTYLVGGCVRDIILGKHPKDFDIATNARPQEVKRAISNAFIIGRRFRLVLVKRGEQQYEVSTFRRDPRPDENLEELPDGDNLFGSPIEDARRRDFTINCLFYDPIAGRLIDYAEGIPDLEAGVVRMIGDPNVRLNEDPIRILRGIRLAHMIRFSLDSDLRLAMQKHSENLLNTALPRRREEILKFLRLDNPALPFLTSLDLGVLDFVSPTIVEILRDTSKNELFLKSLFHFHDKKLESPLELFGGLMLAVYLADNNGVFDPDFRATQILESDRYMRLMRDELGLFKSEQLIIAKAFHLMTLLRARSEFEGRGERRRWALVKNEAFPLAMKLAEREHWLTPSDHFFWHTEAQRFADLHPESLDADPRGPRRRRRGGRRRRRGGGGHSHGPNAEGPAAAPANRPSTESEG